MNINKIKKKIKLHLNLEKLIIKNKGDNFTIIAVGDVFKNLSPVEKQKLIYTPLMKYFLNKTIHAVSIKTYSPTEWKRSIKYIKKIDFFRE